MKLTSFVANALQTKFNLSCGLRRYVKNISWLMGEKILRLVVGMIVGVWVIRYLGPQQFGLLSYALSFVALFSALASLGLEGIVVRELIKDESREMELLGTAFTLKLCGALLLLPVVYIALIGTSSDEQTQFLIFIILSGTIFQSLNVIDFYFQSKVLAKYAASANAIGIGVSSGLKIVLIATDAPLVAFAIMSALDVAILSAGYVYFYGRKNKQIMNWTCNIKTAKALLKDSWPLILSFLFTTISLRIDQIIIKNTVNIEAVGYYAASLKLVEIFYFIPVAITTSLFPKMVSLKGANYYDQKIQALSSLLTYTALALIVVLITVREPLVRTLYGVQYGISSELLVYHLITMLFIFSFSLRKKMLLVENSGTFILLYSLFTSVIMISMLFVLIPINGVVGAAQGYLISWCLSLLVVPILLGRSYEAIFFIRSFNPANLIRLLSAEKTGEN